MQTEFALSKCSGYTGVAAQMRQLKNDILFHKAVKLFAIVCRAAASFDHRVCSGGMTNPFLDRWHGVESAFGREVRLHRAAVGVAANDDVCNAEAHDGIFDRGGHAAVYPLPGRYDVARIADHEQFAGLGLGDEFRYHTAVGTAYHQSRGALPVAPEGLEALLVFGIDRIAKPRHAFHQLFHFWLLLGGGRNLSQCTMALEHCCASPRM